MNGRGLWKPALVAAIATIAVATLGAQMTELGPWYANLRKPPWQPPDWLFPPAWTGIFIITASAGVVAWRSAPDGPARAWVIGLFALNGALNVLWSALFFRLRRPDWALYEAVPFWLSILLLIVVLSRWSRAAGLLLAPYLAWVTFAAALNYAVVELNRPF